ncbi:MAG: VanZ family protein [Pseudomonadota bacterium]
MLPLRYARRWQIASLLLLFAVLAAALTPVVWFWDDRVGGLRWFQNVDKWLHGATFFILAVWFTGMVARSRYAWVVVGLLVFGFVIEGCQYLVAYRSADWNDAGANAAGILLGITLALVGMGGWCERVEGYWANNKTS